MWNGAALSGGGQDKQGFKSGTKNEHLLDNSLFGEHIANNWNQIGYS
jgi:hypothetical protein